MKCEKLDVWKKSARLSANVYKAFEEGIIRMYDWYKESK